MSFKPVEHALTNRHRAMLKAVDAGRAEALCGCAPDLLIDGRYCDHLAAHELFRAGLIAVVAPGSVGQRVAARLTDTGRSVLSPPNGSAPCRS
jgi:hypothetical protein